jgi:hypothetical protein
LDRKALGTRRAKTMPRTNTTHRCSQFTGTTKIPAPHVDASIAFMAIW